MKEKASGVVAYLKKKLQSRKFQIVILATALLCFGVISDVVWAGVSASYMGADVWENRPSRGG